MAIKIIGKGFTTQTNNNCFEGSLFKQWYLFSILVVDHLIVSIRVGDILILVFTVVVPTPHHVQNQHITSYSGLHTHRVGM